MTVSFAETAACNEAAPGHAQLYEILLECGHRGQATIAPGVPGLIWGAIDRLRTEGGAEEVIRILEDVSLQVHVLRLARGDDEAQIAARARIAALTEEWLGVAAIKGCG